MQRLRDHSWLARAVLFGYLAVLAIAIAAPIVHPVTTQIVCSGETGYRLIVLDDDAPAHEVGHGSIDCPACLIAALPTAFQTPPALSWPIPRETAPTAIESEIRYRTLAPLPPRGPPALFRV